MKALIHRTDPGQEYFFKEGCHILEIWNDPADPEVSIARARVEPGVTTRCHCLKATTERYVILSGMGEVYVGELEATVVSAGSVVIIPEGIKQSICNTGTEDLVFLAICTPRFEEDNYFESGS
jgi:mannose-6-phosphate isomerase-like protein (cupin superfamily)